MELAAQNVHPEQLFIYEVNNKRIQNEVEDEEIRAAGKHTIEDQMSIYFESLVKKEKERIGPGERITFDRFMEFYAETYKKMKAETSRPGSQLDSNGDYKDFLEVRRPFIAPDNNAVGSH